MCQEAARCALCLPRPDPECFLYAYETGPSDSGTRKLIVILRYPWNGRDTIVSARPPNVPVIRAPVVWMGISLAALRTTSLPLVDLHTSTRFPLHRGRLPWPLAPSLSFRAPPTSLTRTSSESKTRTGVVLVAVGEVGEEVNTAGTISGRVRRRYGAW